MSTVFFVRLKKKQVVTSRPVLGDVFLFKHTQYSVSMRGQRADPHTLADWEEEGSAWNQKQILPSELAPGDPLQIAGDQAFVHSVLWRTFHI